jgi:hypothetical protein
VDWREYQQAVAALFREAGCGAEVEKTVIGARGKHNVDAYVTFDKYGIKCSWIVECKYWNSSVIKEKVMALDGTDSDCGADRGLIISHRGFQSGAIRAAQKTNITLASLEDLRSYIDDKTEELEILREKLAATEDELEDVRDELSEYRCPDCGSPMVSSVPVWLDEDTEVGIETFECGYDRGGGDGVRPCPFGTDFPALTEYDLSLSTLDSQPNPKFVCHAFPKTNRARRVSLGSAYGHTADEAREQVVERYEYMTTPPRQEFRGKWMQRSGYPRAAA